MRLPSFLKTFCLATALLAMIPLRGQFLNLYNAPLEEQPFFNSDFIDRQGIYMVEMDYQTKPDQGIIRSKGKWVRIYFDGNGRTIRTVHLTDLRTHVDSSVTEYQYDEQGWLYKTKGRDMLGKFTKTHHYDSQGRITDEVVYRRGPEDDSVVEKNPEMHEKSTYQDFFSQWKRIVFNTDGKAYREEVNYFEDGRLSGKSSKYYLGNVKEELRWIYDDQGRIIKFTHNESSVETQERKYTYQYEGGKLASWNVSRNGLIIQKASVVWNEKLTLPEAIIIRDEENRSVEVIRLAIHR